MTEPENNPSKLLRTLDEFLDHPVSLVLYGRASLALGFDRVPGEIGATKDVDVIVREIELAAFEDDEGFWAARDAVNDRYEGEGLYITHIFTEHQVFLRPDWEAHIVPVVRPETRWLKLFRPHTVDLILTKMMRGDDELDLEDIAFMVRHDGITREEMEPAFANVRMPDVVELHDAFARALPLVRGILDRHSG